MTCTFSSGRPKHFISRFVETLNAWIDRSSGVFLSSASPVYAQNAVGMQSVAPLLWRLMNAGLVGSHAV